MNEQFPITGRPRLAGRQPAPELRPAARVQDWGAAMPAPDADLQGLVHGLASFNPAINRWAQAAAEQEHAQQQEQQRTDEKAGAAYGQTVENPLEALRGAEPTTPAPLPVAVSSEFRGAMHKQLAFNAGSSLITAAAAEYDQNKENQEFDLPGWLQRKKAEALAGVSDPEAITTIGRRFTEFTAQVEADRRQRATQWAEERKATLLTQRAADVFGPHLGPSQIIEAYPAFLAEARATGATAKESASMLFTRLAANSERLGGAPELFDVFDSKDPEGMTLAARNPQLIPQLEQARQRAKEQRDKGLMQDAEKGNALALMNLGEDLRDRPETITRDRITGLMGQFGPIKSAQSAAEWMSRAEAAVQEKRQTEQLAAHFDRGELYLLPPDQQQKVMGLRLAPTVQELTQAVRQGDAQGIAGAASVLMAAHSASRAGVAVASLKGLAKSLVATLPSAEGPPPQFLAGAELFKAMGAFPQFRDMYFDDETGAVLKAYTTDIANGSEPAAAYVSAYRQTTPEYKAQAEALVKSPEFAKLFEKAATKAVEGSSWWPRLLGGNGRPENLTEVQAQVRGALRDHMTRHPTTTEDEATEFVNTWVQKNYAMDTTTRQAVKVPPSVNGQAAQEAISAYTKRIADAYRTEDRSGSPWVPKLIPAGDQGNYTVTLWQGGAAKYLGNINLGYLMEAERFAKVMSQDELNQLGALRKALASGQAAGQVPALPPELVAKAKAIGALRPDELEASNRAAVERHRKGLEDAFRVSFGAPSADALQFMPAPAGKQPADLTGKLAAEFIHAPAYPGLQGTSSGPGYLGLAASLITVGEGVRLSVHEDPAQGAGKNIAMGYNLKANAKTLREDFKRSGVPEERIDDVVEGRAQLTIPQAQRLTRLALERFERQTVATAEAVQPGLWEGMSPQQKAVMLDLAWQVGSTDQFRKAWQAVAANDSDAFAKETRVYYTNRSGERVEDKRRHGLRSAMLAGLPYWNATLQRYKLTPSTRLQAMGGAPASGE